MMQKLNVFVVLLFLSFNALASYPSHWWEKVPEDQRQGSWEILPHEAKKGEVILSKRNELGVFSNLGFSPFELDKVHYDSIEALWQMMKYPDPTDKKDPRNNVDYPFTREEVYRMSGFDSKRAGDEANKINKKHGFKLISYQKHFFDYKDMSKGSEYHYRLIKRAITQKVLQNSDIKDLLLKTKGLTLKPDHLQGENIPKSYYYHEILMDIRDNLLKEIK